MSQSDFGVIDPNTKSGTQLAVDLNGFRDAVNSGHSGSTRPAYLPAGGHWVRIVSSDRLDLVLYDGAVDYTLRSVNPTTGQKIGIPVADLADKQTSPTDATAGRVLIAEAWGLGSLGVAAPSTDCNNLTRSGFYRINGVVTNGPSGAGTDIIVHVVGGIDIVAQTSYFYGTGQMWVRTGATGAWTSWKEVATSANALFKANNLSDLANAATAFANIKQASTETATGVVELATIAEVQAGTDNTRAITPAGFSAASLGQGQTWQNVFSQRIIGTTYTNTTGKPIQVSIWQASDSGPSLIVDGVTVAFIDGTPAAVSVQATAIVPQNSTYRVTAAVSGWAELR